MRACMKQFASFLDAEDTCIYVQTYEENEFAYDVCNIVKGIAPYKLRDIKPDQAEVFTYSRHEGLYKISLDDPENLAAREHITDVKNIAQLFTYIRKKQDSQSNMSSIFNGFDSFREEISQGQEQPAQNIKSASIFILKDMHLFFDKETIRAFRDMKEVWEQVHYAPIIVTAPSIDLPCELEKLFTYFSYELATPDEIYDYLYPFMIDNYTEKEIRDISQACVGLTIREIKRALAHSVAIYEEADTKIIQEEKVQTVKKSGSLDYLMPKQTLEDTGGYENLKRWIRELKNAMDPEAKAYGIPQPKGAMLVGLPGNGKTMAAEVIANYLNIPLLQLDLARIMGSFVGQSERQIANALRLAKACAPCVMLVDESEKLFGGCRLKK